MTNLDDPKLYINRELSWLAFNERVLGEAKDQNLPVSERLRFLGIVGSNLDEFFMVRVAGLKQQLSSGVMDAAADRMSPSEQLAAIRDRARAMVQAQYRIWGEEVVPVLSAGGQAILNSKALNETQLQFARDCFLVNVLPALTPLAVDQGHLFPHLRNKSLNIAVLLRKGLKSRRRKNDVLEGSLAVVQVPSVLARLVRIPVAAGQGFLLLEDLVVLFVGELFPGYSVQLTAAFRVTRNWDLNFDEDESEDLLSTIEDELRRRDRGAAVRIELEAGAPELLENLLTTDLNLTAADVYRVSGPLQVSDLTSLGELGTVPHLRIEPLIPSIPLRVRESESMFQCIKNGDLLLHHPYDSFDPVVRFLEEAAEDSEVLAIKQTLYRTSADSPIARALARAVDYGKQVTVLVEIKARLDEANNIEWARRMEEAGVHVVYGLVGLKTHCKIALIVRRESSGIKRYIHLGTGNYNPHTAKAYTDVSLFTARDDIGEDSTALFNVLTGYASNPRWKRFAVAPFDLRDKIIALIDRESDFARRGERAEILAKMNALVCPQIIRSLYRASQCGVRIHLIVRGICCLRPGIEGVSHNIRVTSVVDRFLEHSRVFAFGSGDRREVFLSSADWMPRNFSRRVEIMVPVDDAIARARLLNEVLGASANDSVKSSQLNVDGSYSSVVSVDAPFRSQAALMETAKRLELSREGDPIIRHAAAPVIVP